MTARRMPLKTNPFPLLSFTPVNHRIAPTSTTTKAEILPMKIRKSQISVKYPAIRLAKSVRGLRIAYDNIGFTQCFTSFAEFKDLKEQSLILPDYVACLDHSLFLMPYSN